MLREIEKLGASQAREVGAQSLRRIGHHEEGGVVAIPRAPGVLDGQPRLADPAEAVDRLRLGDRRGRAILEAAQLVVAALEERSEGGEGEVVEAGRDGT